ncbi:zona pellucida sperm-binding protein 3-like [Scomber japonicus]|uniref:zona pellucida sperm-binding protein 3-like n=1 Tax=Scomber japonicus TaxID=13676 RepID=UPI002304F43E|nr:zona pellucida sperm-binding protein 3-like [Scomber japonicus]
MESLFFEVKLLVVLFLSGIYVRSSFGFKEYASIQSPQFKESRSSKHPVQQQHHKVPTEEREKVNTISVTCHPDSLEILIKADMFEVGAPVNVDELRLGVEYNEICRATASSRDEYRIVVGLLDCGTKHWMTEDSLVYTNLLIFSPEVSPEGVIRMDEAVIPIECHYERRYSLTSSSLMPTWTPFLSTQAAVETLEFDLRIMTTDFLYERGSNVFYLGEPIGIEASVRVGHHMGLRVFMSSCVATLDPDIYSEPKYTFIENGCLVDSQLPGSRSHFLPRTQDDKLQLVIDAFRFHNEDRGELYITCHLNAIPVNYAHAPNQACTVVNGRWRSADGNDFLCGSCQSQNEVGQTHSKPSSSGKFTPRGFGKPKEAETFWKSGLKSNKVWEQEARVGPMLVLPAKHKSGPLPVDEIPPVLHKISRPTLYGSQWKSGITHKTDLEKGLLPGPPSTSDQVEDLTGASEQNKDGSHVDLSESRTNPKDGDSTPEVTLDTTTAAPSDPSPTTQIEVAVTTRSNATTAESDLSNTNDPTR